MSSSDSSGRFGCRMVLVFWNNTRRMSGVYLWIKSCDFSWVCNWLRLKTWMEHRLGTTDRKRSLQRGDYLPEWWCCIYFDEKLKWSEFICLEGLVKIVLHEGRSRHENIQMSWQRNKKWRNTSKKEQWSNKWITELINELIIMTHPAFLESAAKELPFPSNGPKTHISSTGQPIFSTNISGSINNTPKQAD